MNWITRKLPLLPQNTDNCIRNIKQNPVSLKNWIDLIHARNNHLPVNIQKLVNSHKLTRKGVIMRFNTEIEYKLNDYFNKQSHALSTINVDEICSYVINEFVQLKTIIQCRDTHADGGYFAVAEPHMEWQWNDIIYPMIKNLDFTSVVELAPGHGRNTEFLRKFAKEIHLVDVNQPCIDACRNRFGDQKDGCNFHYYVTDGKSLSMINDNSSTLVYTFDSMVHFDKLVVKDYVFEIARILKPLGTAFLHHSNYGAFKPNSDWASNYGTRSDMSAELMKEYAKKAGLLIQFQRLSGKDDGWGMDDLDCFTILEKP